MNILFCCRFAWRFFKVSLKSGQLTLLMTALILAVSVVIGLTAFVDRVDQMLAGESRQFLAADKVLKSSFPLPQEWLDEAQYLGLKQAQTLHFRSMLYVDDEPMLVSVKAATDNYPLLGKLSYRETMYGDVLQSQQGPKRGEVWLGSRVFQQLSLSLGGIVELGEARLKASAVLVAEPDAGAVAFSFAPKVLMHKGDIEKTEVVQTGSRITYRYLFSGKPDSLSRFEAWVLPKLDEHTSWQDLARAQPGVAKALSRAEIFLRLAISIVLILACFALAMTSLRFSRLQFNQVAVLKTLGVKSTNIAGVYLVMFVIVLCIALVVGSFLGYVLQEQLTLQVANRLALEPVLPNPAVWWSGMAVTLVGFLGFSVPPMLALKSQPAMAIFKQGAEAKMPITFWRLVVSGVALFGMLVLVNGDLLYSGILLVAIVLMIAVLAMPIRMLLKKVVGMRYRSRPWVLLVISNLRRHMALNVLLVSVFASSLMLTVVLLGVKNNLFVSWQNQLPEHTPNFFMVNVQKDEVPQVKQWIKEVEESSDTDSRDIGQTAEPVIYPMVRGRLIAINKQAINTSVSKEDRERAGINRELNLSWSSHLPRDNRLVKGRWFKSSSKHTLPQVSVEEKLAKRLGIKLNDDLGFSIGAETLTARVISIREVDWDRMHPNFFILFEEGILASFHATYMTSFYLPENQQDKLIGLLDAVPTIVVIDLDAVIKQIRSIVQQVSTVLLVILAFVLMGCVLVLIATVQSSLDEREKENALIRALGGSRLLIYRSLLVEFIVLGLISGVLASVMSELVLQVLQVYLLDLPVSLHPGLWWIAPSIGIVLITGAGFLSARKIVRVSPDQLLRQQY